MTRLRILARCLVVVAVDLFRRGAASWCSGFGHAWGASFQVNTFTAARVGIQAEPGPMVRQCRRCGARETFKPLPVHPMCRCAAAPVTCRQGAETSRTGHGP